MTPAPALVTGGTGWLGRRLIRMLEKSAGPKPGRGAGRLVRVLVPPGEATTGLVELADRLEIVRGDLTDPASLRAFVRDARGATVFHAAGVIHPAGRVRPFSRVNRDGTRHLLEAAKRAGIRRLIYVSSSAAVGFNPWPGHLFDESYVGVPYMHYGRSKKQAEELVREAGQDGGLETVIVRSPWFYGPNQPARQCRFIRMIRNGTVPVVGSGDNRRSMAYVDNVCQGLLLAESVRAAAGRTYWIADRKPYTTNDIIATVERVLERDFGLPVAHRRIRLPRVASGVARLLDSALQGLGLYDQSLHVLSEFDRDIACSIDRARTELGYEPAVALEEGMRLSVQWMIDAGLRL